MSTSPSGLCRFLGRGVCQAVYHSNPLGDLHLGAPRVLEWGRHQPTPLLQRKPVPTSRIVDDALGASVPTMPFPCLSTHRWKSYDEAPPLTASPRHSPGRFIIGFQAVRRGGKRRQMRIAPLEHWVPMSNARSAGSLSLAPCQFYDIRGGGCRCGRGWTGRRVGAWVAGLRAGSNPMMKPPPGVHLAAPPLQTASSS
jgi:hypothetical protein